MKMLISIHMVVATLDFLVRGVAKRSIQATSYIFTHQPEVPKDLEKRMQDIDS